MKAMKRMMEGMMPVMMKGVSPEEKQELMLGMMPLMMADVDLMEMMPKMMAAMIPAMLPQLLEAMSREGAAEKRLDRMAGLMPSLCQLIDKRVLAEKKDAMVARLLEREEFRENMPRCFVQGIPLMIRGCFEHFFPHLPKEERQAFIATMIQLLVEAGTGDFTVEERRALLPGGETESDSDG